MKRWSSLLCLLLVICSTVLAASTEHFLDVSIELFTCEA